MTVDFNNIEEDIIPNFLNGDGSVAGKMFVDDAGKILVARIGKGSSIGLHRHETNYEVEFVVQGKAKCTCDGVVEILEPGMCHYCPNGSQHIMESIGDEDLVLYCVVPNCK